MIGHVFVFLFFFFYINLVEDFKRFFVMLNKLLELPVSQ